MTLCAIPTNEWLITESDAATVQQNTASELHWEPRQQEMTEDVHWKGLDLVV